MFETYDQYQDYIERENNKNNEEELEWEWELADRHNDDAKCMANFDENNQND